jgi:hypothetical protein
MTDDRLTTPMRRAEDADIALRHNSLDAPVRLALQKAAK